MGDQFEAEKCLYAASTDNLAFTIIASRSDPKAAPRQPLGLYAIFTVLVDLHLRLYAAEDLAARNHLENNNGNTIKQLHSCPDQLNLSRD